MKTELIYRTATNKDTDKIIKLVKRTLSEFDLPYDPETSEKDLSDIEGTYIHSGGTFEVIEDINSKIVGTAALLKVNDQTGKLRKMYVDKKYRKRGLGKALLKRMLEKAGELDFDEVILETVHKMEAAINLYEKFGFTRVNGCDAASPRCDIVMSKKLTED